MKSPVLCFCLCLCALPAMAQLPGVEETVPAVPVAVCEPQVDSTLLGLDILDIMPPCVSVHQTYAVRSALELLKERNSSFMYEGFRIRIYYDSVQDARYESDYARERFSERYPDIPAYRSYVSPNFKVVVGNFRSRTDAEVVLDAILPDFPDATVVRERFKFPFIGRKNIQVEL